jgi:hypothetical protein
MEYFKLAFSLAWPQIAVGVVWLVVGLAALRYALTTKRPVFLYGGIAALLLSLSEVLSPLRLAYRYYTGRVYCPSTDACTIELRFGAAKFEWVIVGVAAIVFFVGLYLEVSRARKRAAANNAARAVANHAAAAAGGSADGYQGNPSAQPFTEYDDGQQGYYDAAYAQEPTSASPTPDYDQSTAYRRPSAGSGSGSF